ncbi:MAG: sigma-E factor negative regulatory protein RseA [Candidatus Endobugula sp.]|jgi:sigma-E factor negative regulatory protein RseA
MSRMSAVSQSTVKQSTVKQPLQESLSALVDGEADELEVRRLLKADDKAFDVLRKDWSRYLLACSSIKSGKTSADERSIEYRDLSLIISAAIAEEPVHSTNKTFTSGPKAGMWSGVGRFAVAASVAGAIVLGVQFVPNGADNQIVGSEPVTLPSFNVPISFAQGLPLNTVISTVSNEQSTQVRDNNRAPIVISDSTKEQLKRAEEQVNRLMLEHAQNASQNTHQGILPYARLPESTENQ